MCFGNRHNRRENKLSIFRQSEHSQNIPSLVGSSSSVRLFLRQQLLRQKPLTQQRKRNMMMPTSPIAHLIVAKTTLALATMKAFLNPVRRLDAPCVLIKVRAFIVVRQIIIATRPSRHLLTINISSSPIPPSIMAWTRHVASLTDNQPLCP